jgi:hypothetical protein
MRCRDVRVLRKNKGGRERSALEVEKSKDGEKGSKEGRVGVCILGSIGSSGEKVSEWCWPTD